MNPPRQRQANVRHRHRHHRIHPEFHWDPNDEQLREYDRFIPPLVVDELNRNNAADAARFMHNLRVILEQERVHFDMGEGDGSHVWSWHMPPHDNVHDGSGDHAMQPHQQQQMPNRQRQQRQQRQQLNLARSRVRVRARP